MTQLLATVKSYENHGGHEETFTVVVGIEVTRRFRKVELMHQITGADSGVLLDVGPGNNEVRLYGRGKCPFHVGQPLSAKAT